MNRDNKLFIADQVLLWGSIPFNLFSLWPVGLPMLISGVCIVIIRDRLKRKEKLSVADKEKREGK